jgi:hypothetical protein
MSPPQWTERFAQHAKCATKSRLPAAELRTLIRFSHQQTGNAHQKAQSSPP